MKTSRAADVVRLADMMAALGNESRLRIIRLLLSAHPRGLVVGEIQEALDIPGSTLSHHLEKLKHEDLLAAQREGTFVRYRVNAPALEALIGFLYEECCGRNKPIKPEDIIARCRC